MTNSPLRRIAFSIPLIVITTLPGSARPAGSSYDGAWSVVIVTDAGNCDRASRYGVQIVGGRGVAGGGPGGAVAGPGDPRGGRGVGPPVRRPLARGSA